MSSEGRRYAFPPLEQRGVILGLTPSQLALFGAGVFLAVIVIRALPNLLGLTVAAAIVAEASLSFLGLGVQPPTPSWGAMLNDGRSFILVAPHLTLFPGLAILLTVLGLNFLGDGLRQLMNVRAD